MLLIVCIKLIFGLLLSLSGEIEKKIIFKPSKDIRPLIIKNAEIKSFTTKDNLELSYLHIKSAKKYPKIIFCHGYDGNITFKKTQKKLIFLAQNGYEVYALDYRGYGKSQGSPSEKGLYSDIRALIKYLGIDSSNIIIWGHSLGAAVAIDAAVDLDFMGVIEEGGFTSIEGMRTYRIMNAPKKFLRNSIYNSLKITQEFRSEDKITKVEEPLLILHSKEDETIPCEMGVQLAQLCDHEVVFFPEKGGHSEVGWQDEAVLQFIRTVQGTSRHY